MPYDKLSELPDSVKNSLPKHAQEIYKEAYNNAWDQYSSPKNRRDKSSQEETAHKVAWSTVKKTYEKEGDKWVKKKEPKKS
ncbi:ChaB family protein [Fodinibius sp. Rm-B-1B1-1]|uniref:ChaB family protein n=1 Tax=Fodinibius alkaliphilus TaxID=3140241 RepID=UPI00315ABC78